MDFLSRTVLRLGQVRGIPIRLHASLAIVLPLLAFSFGRQLASAAAPASLRLPPFFWGGMVAAGLFASVLLHELAHSICAIRLGGRVRAITLLFLGGVSEVEDALPPRREAVVALVGPLASLLLGAALVVGTPLLVGLPNEARLALRFVGVLNLALGLFNLAPAFPLDGGRLLRALLASRLGRLRATRIAANVGKVVAVGVGILGLRTADVALIAVAIFIFFGARREAEGVEREEASGGLRVHDATARVRLTLPVSTRAADAIGRFRSARSDHAVVIDALDRPVGMVSVAAVAAAPEAMLVADLPGAQAGSVCRDVPVYETLARMRALGVRTLPVVGPGGALVGVVRRDDLEALLDGAPALVAAGLYPRSSS